MEIDLKDLLGMAATVVGIAGSVQLYAMRAKKQRKEELETVMQRLEEIEKDLRQIEEDRRDTENTMRAYGTKIDTLVAQVGDMNILLQKLLDIQLSEHK